MTYDANGSLTTLTDPSGTTTYTWNVRNQLVALTGPGTTASFQYDAFGRRVRKTVNGSTIDVLYDRFTAVQELSGGTPLAALFSSLSVDEILTRTDATGLRAFLDDGLGSTLALTDSTGAVVTEYTYDPFGKTTASGTTSTNAFQYTERENDSTGLYYYRARYYHPTLQRFVSQDPIGFAGGDVNTYAYIGNNPLSWTDPSGYAPKDKTYGLPKDFWNWYHRQMKEPGDPDLDREEAEDWYDYWKNNGKPDPEGHKTEDPNSHKSCPPSSPDPNPLPYDSEHPEDPQPIIPMPVDPLFFPFPEPFLVPVPGFIF